MKVFRRFCCLGFSLVCLLGQGCQTVEPWEKQAFVRPSMQEEGDVLSDQLKEHAYFSREAASGGRNIGGGGCGCN